MAVPAPRALVPSLVFLGTCVAVISSLGAPLVPAIAADTGASPADAQWTLTVTLLVGAVATPVVGRLGDGPHRRPVVLTVLALVVAGGVLAALPLGLGWLVAGRGLQGFGLGLTPLVIATARDVLAGERARSAAAALSLTTAAGLGLGYPLTGLIAELGGVHAAFWFGAAFTAVALAVATVVFPPSPPRDAPPLDVVGALLLGAGLAGALLVLSEGEAQGWGSPWLLVLAAVAVVALAAWVVWELRRPAPLVDLRLARGRTAAVAHVAALLVGVANYLMITGVTFLAQTPVSSGYGFGASVVLSGLVLLPFSAGSMLGGRVARGLAERGRGALVLPCSAVVIAVAAALFATVRGQLWELFALMGVCGTGVGGAFSAFPGLITRAVPAGETGSAMSLNQVLRYVGFATGSALTATLLEVATPEGGDIPASSGYTAVGLLGCAVALVTAVLTTALLRRPAGTSPAAADARVTGR
ncbi:MFS transporter [Geodermatophilus sp. SYSU D00815]